MFLSKNAITLLSSIGASSIPVVSVISLYKIKSFARGNDVEAVSSVASEENVISEIQPEQPKSDEEQSPTEEEPQVQATEDSAETVVTTTESESPPQPKNETAKVENNDKGEDNKANVVATTTTSTTSEEREKEITRVEDLTKLASDLLKEMMNQSEPNYNTNIKKNIESFVQLLTGQEKIITDKQEKADVKTVIDAFNKLKEKIDENV